MRLSGREFIFSENPDYLSKQLITYLGNKRNLLSFIGLGLEKVRKKLGRKKLRSFDVFSGSGIVSRYLKQYSDKLFVNDLEDYSRVISSCYLTNRSELDYTLLKDTLEDIKTKIIKNPVTDGFIKNLYSPGNDVDIKFDERVFYTVRNGEYLDSARFYLESVPPSLRNLLLAPLLSEASIHANTSGVFKGFYKNRKTGIGQYGGNNGDALLRILGNIELQLPVLSNYECETKILQGDATLVASKCSGLDVAYLDPPYNQHPYGSNYFMLNLLVNYKKPEKISQVSGIPVDWNRSRYNKKKEAYDSFERLVKTLNSKYLLISFNSEGYISLDRMKELLSAVGKVEVLETRYNTFRGSRNLGNRSIHIKEYLYLVEKR